MKTLSKKQMAAIDEVFAPERAPEDDPASEVDRDNFNAAQESQHQYDEQHND
jgi:hypothetical protein